MEVEGEERRGEKVKREKNSNGVRQKRVITVSCGKEGRGKREER